MTVTNMETFLDVSLFDECFTILYMPRFRPFGIVQVSKNDAHISVFTEHKLYASNSETRRMVAI